jgi:hypothetical protein
MWVIWFGPLVVVFFLVGMTIGAVLLRLGRLRSPRAALAAVALPFGFAALPVLALALLSLAASLFAPDDHVLYAELFGSSSLPGPVPDRERMLFDAFGEGPTREVLLRLDATPAERDRLLALPGLTPAAMTPDDFALRGTRHGLDGWWMRPASPGVVNRAPGTDCLSPTIYQADGFNGWRELRLARCASDPGADRGDAPPLFVSAYGR